MAVYSIVITVIGQPAIIDSESSHCGGVHPQERHVLVLSTPGVQEGAVVGIVVIEEDYGEVVVCK
jgi:hypothetical protein